jgi:RNA polymerase sigma-70 factor (ECF subfamily)
MPSFSPKRGQQLWHPQELPLPAEYRWSVLLADVEEFSYQEIAGILSCPIGTVMSRINRGRKMLARLLRSCQQEQPKPRYRGKDADV